MARSLTQLTLFLSCTSELEAERKLAEKVVVDVNRTLEGLASATIRILDWRRDLVPGVSTDPQQVIHSQTRDCDIYLGMLGSRFGTPTPRAGSGTEDEFNLAYERFRTDPRSLRILFYFRTGQVGNIYKVDHEQLRRVQEFRKRLGEEKGVLFCDFESPEHFLSLLRDHLIQLVSNKWDGAAWRSVPGLEPTTESVAVLVATEAAKDRPDDEEEATILDLSVDMDDSLEAITGALGGIAQLMEAGSEADQQWKAEVDRLVASGAKPKKAQRLVNAKAHDFGQRAAKLRPLTATFRTASADYFEKMERIFELQLASGVSTRKEAAKSISKLSAVDASARAAREVYVQIFKLIAGLPDPTKEFRRQKRRLASQVENLNTSIAFWLDRSAALRAQFDENGGENA